MTTQKLQPLLKSQEVLKMQIYNKLQITFKTFKLPEPTMTVTVNYQWQGLL